MARNGGSQGAVIVMSSHVVRGTVGNRAAVLALEVLGYPVWAVPTVTLPWHPGHGPASRIIAAPDAFDAMIDDLAGHPALAGVCGMVTGYFGNGQQVAAAGRLVDALKRANADAVYLLDPVMGDVSAADPAKPGRLYVAQGQADAIVDMLLPRCDWVTPNPFELSVLGGRPLARTPEAVAEAAQALARDTVVVTSVPALRRGHIGNLMVHGGRTTVAEHPVVPVAGRPLNGLGDLASALLLGRYLADGDREAALRMTSASLHDVMATSAGAGADELLLERAAERLVRPRGPVEMRQLVRRRTASKR